MTRYFSFLLPLALCVVLGGCGNLVERPVALGEADEISGVDADGKEVKLSDYRGKVVLVDFWFDTCPPCRENHVHERSLIKQFKDRPFVILGVNIDRDLETMRRSEKAQQMTWTSIWDGTKNLNCRAYNVDSVPTMFLVDHKGRLATQPVAGLPNETERTQMEAKIGRLVREAEKDAPKTVTE